MLAVARKDSKVRCVRAAWRPKVPSGSLRLSSELPTPISPSLSRILNVLCPQAHLGNTQAQNLYVNCCSGSLAAPIRSFLKRKKEKEKECKASVSQPSQASNMFIDYLSLCYTIDASIHDAIISRL